VYAMAREARAPMTTVLVEWSRVADRLSESHDADRTSPKKAAWLSGIGYEENICHRNIRRDI
jgi:hypothetical protein